MTSLPSIKDLLALCKLKVVSLILLTAVVGMLLAVPYLPNFLLIVVASVGISLSAMSAAVFNHIIDEKIDAQMSRTDRRPLPKGKVTRNQALIWGLFLGFVGLGLLFFFFNIFTAVLTFLSPVFYTPLRALETIRSLVCRLLFENKSTIQQSTSYLHNYSFVCALSITSQTNIPC